MVKRHRHKLELAGLMTFVIVVGLLLAFVYRGTASPQRCDHGASSIYAWTDVHGVEHVSKPVTTGCVPAGLRSP